MAGGTSRELVQAEGANGGLHRKGRIVGSRHTPNTHGNTPGSNGSWRYYRPAPSS